MEHGASERVKEQSHPVMPVKTEVDKAAQSTAYCEIQANANYTEEEPGLPELVKSEPALLVKAEVVEDGWHDIAELQCMQGPSTSAVVGSTDVFDSIGDLDNILNVKEELGAIDIGPTVLQHTDAWYTTNQKDVSVVKQERAINHDKTDPILCVGVKDEIIEDERRGSLTPQDTLMEQPGACTALHSLRKECLETVCRVELRRLDAFQCDVCDAVYIDTHKLRQHVQDVHGPRPQGSLRQHVKSPQISKEGQKCATDSEPRIYTCDYCKKMFTHKVNMRRHIAEVHSSRSYKCHQCDKIFRCKKYLMMHKTRVHPAVSSPVVYTCDYCHKTYARKHVLVQHIDVVHTNVRYRCSECNAEFKGKHLLQGHMKRVHLKEKHESAESSIYSCVYCKKTFTDKGNIRKHIAHVHSSGSYKCHQCNKIFKCKHYLGKHTASVHPAADTDDQRSNEVQQARTCDKCAKTFASKASFLSHDRNVHSAESYKCTKCDRKFPSKSYLYRHTRYAHSEQQYECAVCKKVCRSKAALTMHVYHVHRLRPKGAESSIYSCDYCKKIFADKGTIRTHVARVNSSGSYKCHQCDKIFKCKEYLMGHKTKVHPAGSHQLHACTNCGKNFSSKWYCQQHEKRGICARPTAGNTSAAASTSRQQHNVDIVKEEPADGELDLGPVVFQHMDCNYRPYKQEPQLD